MRKGVRVVSVLVLLLVLSNGSAAFGAPRDSQQVGLFARLVTWTLGRLSPPIGTPDPNSRLYPPIGDSKSRLSPPGGAPTVHPQSRFSPPGGAPAPPPPSTTT